MRPAKPEEISTAARLAEYRAAVHGFELAFDVAEREAKRIKDHNSTELERQRLSTARKLLNIGSDNPPHRRSGRQPTSAPGGNWTVSSSCRRPR